VIACDIALREVCQAVASSPNIVDLEFLTQGYHDTPAEGRRVIQERVHAVPPAKYDAILLGYGLCANMIVGVTATHTPLVIPRAHDCMTFFLGSKERYEEVFRSQTGAYFYSPGWLESRRRRRINAQQQQKGVSLEKQPACAEWTRQFGEEGARYLEQVMEAWAGHYTRGVLIDPPSSGEAGCADAVKRICEERGWRFERLAGDNGLLQRWLDGAWNDSEFLILRPGERVIATCDANIVGSAAAQDLRGAGR
jgi:hypothetical protein